MKHVMIDLETLDTRPSAVVLSIGAVRFDPVRGELGQEFYRNLRTDHQVQKKRTINPDTERWWDEQSPAAKAALATPAPWHVGFALEEFSRFCAGVEGVWGHGATFDVSLMESLYDSFELSRPWKYSAARDTRTIFEAADTWPTREAGVHHYALDDAKRQAEAVCEAYHELRATKHPRKIRARMLLHKMRHGTYYNWGRGERA